MQCQALDNMVPKNWPNWSPNTLKTQNHKNVIAKCSFKDLRKLSVDQPFTGKSKKKTRACTMMTSETNCPFHSLHSVTLTRYTQLNWNNDVKTK